MNETIELKGFFNVNQSVTKEIKEKNVWRIFYLSGIMTIVHIAYILSFSFNQPTMESTYLENWAQFVILSHSIMLVVVIFLCFLSFYMLKKKKTTSFFTLIMTEVTAILYLLFGVSVTAASQGAISSVTPFLLTAIGVSAILLIPPFVVLINFSIIYVIFYVTIDAYQLAPEIILSSHLNAFTSVAISIGLAHVLWKNVVTQMEQRHKIEKQHEVLEAANKRLDFLVTYDPLTKLYNRMKFMDIVNGEISNMKRNGYEGSIIIFDLDNFKNINDQFGHPIGDKVLQEVGQIIINNIGEKDSAARLGGEEFIILLRQQSVEESVITANRLREKIATLPLKTETDATVQVTASFGVAPFIPTGDDPFQTSYSEADRVMYIAKTQGGNRVEAIPFILTPSS
ncbi:MAG: GGDEF domain-containing protein [Bacillus sp. (in: Bacteria)]|nr:GGDEF domain-containing protein [Bacillus sp. (in: firmicutes)]